MTKRRGKAGNPRWAVPAVRTGLGGLTASRNAKGTYRALEDCPEQRNKDALSL